MSKENEKVVEFKEQEDNETTEIQAVKKGPVAWFKGLKTWQKIALGGTAIGVTVYGGIKLYKILGKGSKEVVEAVGEVIPMDTVTDTVEELAKAE